MGGLTAGGHANRECKGSHVFFPGAASGSVVPDEQSTPGRPRQAAGGSRGRREVPRFSQGPTLRPATSHRDGGEETTMEHRTMEHRWNRRVPISLPVTVLRRDEVPLRCRTRDLATEGMQLALDGAQHQLPSGIHLDLWVEIPGGWRLSASGVVVHSGPRGVGLMFDRCAPRLRRLVEQRLESRRGAAPERHPTAGASRP
jgi:hypothetical protein